MLEVTIKGTADTILDLVIGLHKVIDQLHKVTDCQEVKLLLENRHYSLTTTTDAKPTDESN
jgi:hypothetical protein